MNTNQGDKRRWYCLISWNKDIDKYVNTRFVHRSYLDSKKFYQGEKYPIVINY